MQTQHIIFLVGALILLLFAGNGFGNAWQLAVVGGKPQNGFQKLLANAAEMVFFTAEELTKEIEKIGNELGNRIEKANEQAKNAGDAAKKVSDDVKNEIKNLSEKHTELYQKQQDLIKKQQEQLDDLEKKAGKLGTPSRSEKTVESELKNIFTTSEQFKAYKARQTRAIGIEMPGVDLFKASTMTIGSNLTQTASDIILPARVPGIVYAPDRRVHARQLLPIGTTDGTSVAYVEETAISNATAVVAEGASKPQSDFALTGRRAPVTKIATFLRISDELLEDLPGLTSYITVRFTSKLKLEEDRQILTGSGVGSNLTGLITAASSYTDVFAATGTNRFDILVAAITQIAVSEYAADYILVHPRDYMLMALTKGSDGHYVFPGALSGATMTVFGVPVVSSTMVLFDTFLVGDFGQGAMIFDRKAPSIRFYDQDSDNATKNLITVVIEERLALPIFRPTAFVTGSFNAGLANGSA